LSGAQPDFFHQPWLRLDENIGLEKLHVTVG
jgi:hypothetical protein